MCGTGPVALAPSYLDLESKLAAAEARVAELEDLLRIADLSCESFTHKPSEYHKWGNPCPHDARLRRALAGEGK